MKHGALFYNVLDITSILGLELDAEVGGVKCPHYPEPR